MQNSLGSLEKGSLLTILIVATATMHYFLEIIFEVQITWLFCETLGCMNIKKIFGGNGRTSLGCENFQAPRGIIFLLQTV